MSDLKIIYKPIAELKGYEKNSRTHSDEQINQISASITEFGFTNPLLIQNDGTIIAGHGRLEGAKMLGMETVPTITLSGLTDTQIKALVIADNKIAMNAGWDYNLLSEQVQELELEEFNLDLTGFNLVELESITSCNLSGGDMPEAEYEEMGITETENNGDNIFRQLVVKFETEDDFDDFVHMMGQTVTDKTKYIFYPIQVEVSAGVAT